MISNMLLFCFSGKAFHKLVESGCKDLIPFSYKSISEVSHGYWAIRPVSQFMPNMSAEVKVRALCGPVKFFYSKLGEYISFWT